jgi:hypothetical protein
MGNQNATQFGRYIGDTVNPGETRPLRNIRFPDGPDGLIKDYNGIATIKEIFDKNARE